MGPATFLWVLGLIHAGLAANIPVKPDFQYKQVVGQWHRLAMVLQGTEPIGVASKMRIFAMPKGDLSVGRNTIVREACTYIEVRCRNAGQPGVFDVFHLGGKQSKIHVVATDYEDYLVVHIQSGNDKALYLFGKGPSASDKAKEKFQNAVNSLGFSGTVQYPKPDESDRCPFPQ